MQRYNAVAFGACARIAAPGGLYPHGDDMKRCAWAWAALWLSALSYAGVDVQGFTPVDIDKWVLQREYRRIWRAIDSDSVPPDTSAIIVRYYLKRMGTAETSWLPEWGGGGAVGKNLVIVPVDADPFLHQSFLQVTAHELTHIVLARAAGDVALPRWFHEGLAMTLSGEIGFDEQVVLSRALLTGSLMPLASIDSVNDFPHYRAMLAYCESHQAAALLISRYGLEIIPQIIAAARSRGDFWSGMDSVLATTPVEFESAVRQTIRNRYQFIGFIADTYMAWIGAAFLFLAGYMATRMRNRRRLREMGAAEQAAALKAAAEAAAAPDPGAGAQGRNGTGDGGGWRKSDTHTQ
jgi:hypothetical protein